MSGQESGETAAGSVPSWQQEGTDPVCGGHVHPDDDGAGDRGHDPGCDETTGFQRGRRGDDHIRDLRTDRGGTHGIKKGAAGTAPGCMCCTKITLNSV